MKLAIRCLDQTERGAIFEAAAVARDFYPNDGETSPREAIRLAFRQMRRRIVECRESVLSAASAVHMDAYRYEDM